ncbi:MAG TPA: glycosyl hydrolase [Verrucomicrobiae bacterium]|nr:glycosyl hydrolase [Verrucomicrobiae bacterium]
MQTPKAMLMSHLFNPKIVFWNKFEALKKNVSGIRFGFYLWLLLLVMVSVTDAYSQIQIVNCDAPIQSRKRGIACNALSAADFEALAPGISWYYNWGATPLTKPADVTMDFIPMAWNGNSSFQTQIASYLAAGNRPWRVFALNEPNLAGQAFMTPSNSAMTFLQVKAICDPYNIPVIAPHMAIGSATADSITAYDPIQGSNVTYTYQEPFLSAFLYYCGATPPAGMSTHSYGGYGEITWILGTMHTDFPTQKIWLTEFNPSSESPAPTNDAMVLANLIPAVDYCERTPWVEGYSWFKERISGDSHNSLLGSSGVLTAAGQAYVQMPVHDTNLYYRIPGRLQAERYVALNQMNIAPTTDVDGLADMTTTATGASLDYNIQVDSPGNYLVNFRVAGAVGVMDIYSGSTLLGKAVATQGAWSTFSTTIALPAGAQTLHIVFTANNQRVNWMEFVATNNPPVLAAISNQTILAGRILQITNSASDPDAPPQLLTYSLLNPPAGATIDTNSGVFTWRPAIAQSPSTQTVTVVVSDNGIPPLAATQSFTTTVIQPAMPTINTASITNGQFGFWLNGDTGPDYIVQASTNLTFWYPISTNDSPTMPYFWADTNLVSYPFLFYRISLGP